MTAIQKPKGYDEMDVWGETMKLPAGGYVVEIKAAEKEVTNKGSEYIKVAFDICEGDYAGFFVNQYRSSTFRDKQYKGRIKLWLPNGDGSDLDNVSLKTLKTNITAIEESNNGFRWNWDTDTLKGLKTGLVFRNREYLTDDGKHGFYTEPFRFYDIEKIRSGEFEVPPTKMLDEKTDNNPLFDNQQSQQQSAPETPAPIGFDDITDSDVPF